MNEKAPKLLYSINEVSSSICIGRTSVYAEIKNGNLDSVMVGKLRLITAESLKKWVERKPIDASILNKKSQ